MAGGVELAGVGVELIPSSGSGAVTSVFGRTGAVIAMTGDYTIAQIGGLGTGVATALGNTAGASGGFALFGSTPPTGAAGGSLKGAYPNPGLADVNTIATSLAIGGATIGSDALGVTGTATISGQLTAGSFVPTSATVPTNGMYLAGANTLGFSTASTLRWTLTAATGSLLSGASTSGPALLNQGTSATLPGFVPNRSDTATGFGAQASGNISAIVGGVEATRFGSTGVQILNGGLIVAGGSSVSWNGRGIITSPPAGSVQLGATDAAAPVAQTLQVQGSRAGTDSNIGGANLVIQPGTGTGTGTISTLALKAPVAVAGGTGAQTQTTGLTIKAGTAVLTSYIVSALPAAATAGAGATAFVTDASTTVILGLGTTVVGSGANKVPVYSDGTNWIIG